MLAWNCLQRTLQPLINNNDHFARPNVQRHIEWLPKRNLRVSVCLEECGCNVGGFRASLVRRIRLVLAGKMVSVPRACVQRCADALHISVARFLFWFRCRNQTADNKLRLNVRLSVCRMAGPVTLAQMGDTPRKKTQPPQRPRETMLCAAHQLAHNWIRPVSAAVAQTNTNLSLSASPARPPIDTLRCAQLCSHQSHPPLRNGRRSASSCRQRRWVDAGLCVLTTN